MYTSASHSLRSPTRSSPTAVRGTKVNADDESVLRETYTRRSAGICTFTEGIGDIAPTHRHSAIHHLQVNLNGTHRARMSSRVGYEGGAVLARRSRDSMEKRLRAN